MDNRELKIINTVEGYKDDVYDFIENLVREPSTLGNELSALNVMELKLKELGYNPIKIPIKPKGIETHQGYAPTPWESGNRYNLVAKIETNCLFAISRG
jgi:acetylornithine deacetylase/succinyl-diaminopimelate desuccinylase-like protein